MFSIVAVDNQKYKEVDSWTRLLEQSFVLDLQESRFSQLIQFIEAVLIEGCKIKTRLALHQFT